MIKISGTTSGSISVDQPARGVAGSAEQESSAASQGANPVQAEEVVSLSSRATDAAALFKGVAAADHPEADPEVQRLAQSVADGSYRPDATKVANALRAQERLIARKLGRD